jgi:tagatose 1,6-diphosphate aldolase
MKNRRLAAGKVRRLQTTADDRGVFRVLAIDHRAVLVKMMDPGGGGNVPPERVTRLKLDVVRRVGPLASAVILDQEFSALQAIAGDALPGNVGLIISLAIERLPAGAAAAQRHDAAWSVADARQIGASAVKLYLAYHPDALERRSEQEDLVRRIVEQCAEEAMPLFLEPVACSIDPDVPVGSARFAQDLRRIAIETAQRLGALGPDVLKLPFPVDVAHTRDEAVWRAVCGELGDASPVPWVLLSAGEPFDVFKTQLQVACEAGCSGFMAGRSVWQDAALTLDRKKRDDILEEVVAPRMEALNRIAERYGHAWRERRSLAPIDGDWSPPVEERL